MNGILYDILKLTAKYSPDAHLMVTLLWFHAYINT